MAQSQQQMLSLATVSDVAGFVIATLYTLAGQAHFTARITPSLAAQIEEMTPNSHRAFRFLNVSYSHLKMAFGAFDLIAAALLWRKRTRKSGLAMAVVGFGGGLYGQWFSNEDINQVAAFLGLAVLGYLTAPSSGG